jgi:CheY-like chemotaxis protein
MLSVTRIGRIARAHGLKNFAARRKASCCHAGASLSEKHMNVMIVEDESIIALELERIVEEEGHRVICTVSTMEQALAYAKKADIALVDLGLSDGMSGSALARRLIDRFGLEVIFVTGSPNEVGHGIDGARAVIAKPFTDERIAAALAAAAKGLGRIRPSGDTLESA